MSAPLFLGYEATQGYDGSWRRGGRLELERDALVQHAFVCGATGYGKTVFAKGLVEQAILSGIPVIVVDLKGDLASLALCGPRATPALLQEVFGDASDEIGAEFTRGLAAHRAVEAQLPDYVARVEPRIFTPNSSIGRRVALAALPSYPTPPPDPLEAEDREQLVEALVHAFALSMYGTEPQVKRHENAVKLIEELVRWCNQQGRSLEGAAGIRTLQELVAEPPFDFIGGMSLAEYLPHREQQELRRKLASRIVGAEQQRYEGEPLSVDTLLGDVPPGKVPLAIVYLGHVNGFAEQSIALAGVCADIYRWMRRQGGSTGLRLLLYVDEVGGGDNRHAFYPSYPYNPPSKAPLALLVKQGRSAGVGTLLATQNPVSVDVRGLGNVDTWAIGRLTRKNDLARIGDLLDAIPGGGRRARQQISNLPTGTFLTVSGGLPAPLWVRERWLFSVHRQLSSPQVAALAASLQAPPRLPGPSAGPPPVPPLPRDDGETILLDEITASPPGAAVTPAPIPGCWRLSWAEHSRSLADQQPCIVGRSGSADVILEDQTISRRHLELEPSGARIHLAVRGKNPASLGQLVITGELWLEASDAPHRITLGRSELILDWS
ncbi:MAG TPA: DUF853 family protein [Deltaproteobacteria bacterium]|nr:DUF853 family protein [Deltaproteobacteria bacterium]